MAKHLHVCTMVFNRHDLLADLFTSLARSTRRPDGVVVVDHGYDEKKIQAIENRLDGIELAIVTLEDPGCALAANWLLKNVPDDRLGCGDDVIFEPDAIEIMARTEGDFIIPEPTLNPAACCIIRDSCVAKVGYFDEKISPGFLYFEDTDYIRRMGLIGVQQTVASGARVVHQNGGSQTMQRYTPAQMEEHHVRFRIAHANYVKKWGGEPFHETLTTPREL